MQNDRFLPVPTNKTPTLPKQSRLESPKRRWTENPPNETKQNKAKQEKTDQAYMAESSSLVSWSTQPQGENMNISQMQTERKMHNAGTILA